MGGEVLESELELLRKDVESGHFDEKSIILEQVGEFIRVGVETWLHR